MFNKKILDAPAFRGIPRYAGAGVALFGLLIVTSWYAHWRPILQMLPDTAPMQFNTAWCFILSGAALFLLTTRHEYYAPWLALAVGLFAALILVEYVTGADLSIDQLFFKPYFEADTAYPGRMSPLAAICFVFTSAGLILTSPHFTWPQRLTVAGMFACIVGVVALVALVGFAFNLQSAYGWGSYSRMAINSTVLFLILGGGLLVLAWQLARRANFNFLRWLPVTGSVTLMAMIAFVSAVNMTELRNASAWRKHTFQVILSAQAFQDNLTALQLGLRGYVTLHDLSALAAYEKCLKLEPSQFVGLVKMTRDNPAQQQQLKALATAMNDVFAYDRRMLAIYEQEGFVGISKNDATGEGRRVFGNTVAEIKKFSEAEKKSWLAHSNAEEADSDSEAQLLLFGSVLAAALLVFANNMASRELLHRQRAEAVLSRALLLQKAILNSADYGIFSTDLKGVVQTFNPAAARMLGYTAAEIIGKTTPMLWHDPQEIAERAEKLSRKLSLPVKANFEVISMQILFAPNRIDESEASFIRKDGSRFTSSLVVTVLTNETGDLPGFTGIFRDISEHKQYEAEREKLIAELQTALAEVKTLSGMIPICGWCKNIRSDKGYWQSVEQYVHLHTDATFSHGICPECAEKMKVEILKADA